MAKDPRRLIELNTGQAPSRTRRGSVDEGLPPGSVSVSEIVGRIEQTLVKQIGDVMVVGEISSFRRWRNGNWYFDLRDRQNVLPAVMRPNQNGRVSFEPEDGSQVLARGRIDFYRQQAKAQLVVSRLTPLGRGQILDAFERIKARLLAEGLFDPSRKRPVPRLPHRVGVVTSPQGAAIHDIVKVLRARAPGVSVLLSPTRVQGNGASKDIAEALRRLDGLGRCDVIIIGRGGGSFEDLMSFNMEVVVRAIAGCQTPVISSVGHESDSTLSDLAADMRAATPSNAAEIAVASVTELGRSLHACERRLTVLTRSHVHAARHRLHRAEKRLRDPRVELSEKRRRLQSIEARLARASPRAAVEQARRTLGQHSLRFFDGTREAHRAAQRRLERAAAHLHALSPLSVLDRGYTLATRPDGGLVTQVRQTQTGDELQLRFADGVASVEVTGRELAEGRLTERAGSTNDEPPESGRLDESPPEEG